MFRSLVLVTALFPLLHGAGVLAETRERGAPADRALGESPWRVVSREPDGLVLESRQVEDSAFEELRVRGWAGAPPRVLADAVWTWRSDGVEARLVRRRVVLSEERDERVVYQLMQPPLVSPRESLLRFRRELDASGRAARVSFRSESGAPPERHAAVRVALVRGEWRFLADATGTRLEYRCLGDPGGDLPPWVAVGAQRELALALVREAIAGAQR